MNNEIFIVCQQVDEDIMNLAAFYDKRMADCLAKKLNEIEGNDLYIVDEIDLGDGIFLNILVCANITADKVVESLSITQFNPENVQGYPVVKNVSSQSYKNVKFQVFFVSTVTAMSNRETIKEEALQIFHNYFMEQKSIGIDYEKISYEESLRKSTALKDVIKKIEALEKNIELIKKKIGLNYQ